MLPPSLLIRQSRVQAPEGWLIASVDAPADVVVCRCRRRELRLVLSFSSAFTASRQFLYRPRYSSKPRAHSATELGRSYAPEPALTDQMMP